MNLDQQIQFWKSAVEFVAKDFKNLTGKEPDLSRMDEGFTLRETARV